MQLEAVRACVALVTDLPGSDDDPLELDSLALVQLVELLEARFGFVVRATELVPSSFASVSALARFVAAKAP